MLSPWGQRGLEAKIFGLDLVGSSSCNAGLVLTTVVLMASLSVIKITSFTLRSSLIGNCCLLYNGLLYFNFDIWHCWDCRTGCDFLVLINFYVGASVCFCNWCNISGLCLTIFFQPWHRSFWPRPQRDSSLALLTSLTGTGQVKPTQSCLNLHN